MAKEKKRFKSYICYTLFISKVSILGNYVISHSFVTNIFSMIFLYIAIMH